MVDRSVLVRLRADISQFNRQMLAASSTTKMFVKDLDAADSHMARLVQTVVALAPALVPVGGAAVAAIAGLANQLGFAAAGAGATLLAFKGVGDALEALNKYQLDPTEAHLKKLNETMGELGVSAQEFVLFLDDIQPELEKLQLTAADGLLPGATEGLRELMELAPQVGRILHELTDTTGDLIASAGDNLNDDRWRAFFEFLEREARPTLTTLGQTTGNLIEALANAWMAFDPVNDQFGEGLLNWTRNFAEATRNLDDNEGFQGFLEYVQRVGPEAAATLGELVDMLAAFVAAMAPVGEATLPIITAIARVLSVVAESPAGPVLFATAAGMSALSRAVALYNVANGSAVSNLLGRIHKDGKGAGAGAHAAAAGLGVLALSVSDLDEKLGLSNTAMFTMLGLMAGPWGAAVGAAIGFTKDLADSNDDLEESMRNLDKAASKPGAIQERAKALEDLRGHVEAIYKDKNLLETTALGIKNFFTMGGSVRDFNEGTRQIELQGEALEKYRLSVIKLHDQTFPEQLSLLATGFDDPQLEDFINKILPAIHGAGLDLEQVLNSTGAAWDNNILKIRGWLAEQDSVAGRSRLIGDTLLGLQDEMLSTADSAAALEQAMKSLFGPFLNQSEATDAWIGGLRELRKVIEENNGVLKGNSDAALANREAIRSSVEDLQNRIAADARAGVSGRKLAKTLLEGRDAIIAQATAAGVKKADIEAYLDTLGMTPDNLITVITTPGLLTAKQQIQALSGLYDLTPKEVRTLIEQLGMVKSREDIRGLAREYNLTPKEVRTLIEANASGAFDTIHAVKGELASIPDRTVNLFIRRAYVGQVAPVGIASPQALNLAGQADGGILTYANGGMHRPAIGGQQPQIQANRGPRGIMWAETGAGPWEAFISGHPGKRNRSRAIADDVVARLNGEVMWFADGGVAGRRRDPFAIAPLRDLGIGDFNRAIRQLTKELDKLGKGVEGSAKKLDRAEKILGLAERRLERQRDQLQDLRSDRTSLRKEAAGTFRNDPFGNGLEGAMLQLEADRNDARKMRAALRRGRRLGLDGPALEALAASGDLLTARQLDTRREIRQFEKAFEQRQAATAALGRFAGNAVFGKAIDRQTEVVRRLDKTVTKLEKRLDKLDEAVERGARRGVADRDRRVHQRGRTG